MNSEILCVGEVLWDALPDGLFLGGAPFNVASHLQALGRSPVFASRVGHDRLGQEALRRAQIRGLATDPVQVDDALPTGFVQVDTGEPGEPDYDILEPAAWDAIAFTDALAQHAHHAEALVYGSLAQRAPTSRQTIQRLCEAVGLRVFDVNLRPPYVDRGVIEASLRAADVVKLNDAELRRMRAWFGLRDAPEGAMADLADAFGCRAVCVTWGGHGARLWAEGQCWHHSGYAVDVADTVGAGDAFLSAFLAGFLEERTGDALLDLANRLGAYVSSRAGAFPSYNFDGLDGLLHLDLERRNHSRTE
ncbi:MAG: carbohydrate kinase [Salinibacter sp.]|uniref:carbohydrate kinase family protein n=1 Tax=Salinibacter sp. TaxID=2065818 RepID=UPI002FC307F2